LYSLFLCLWLIALFIFLNNFRTKADFWISATFFFWGCGGFGFFLAELNISSLLLSSAQILLTSMFLAWGPFGLLMYAMEYSGLRPASNNHRHIMIYSLALPPALVQIIVFASWVNPSGETAGPNLSEDTYLVIFAALYCVTAAALLTRNLIHRRANAWRSEVLTSYILVVPIALALMTSTYILPGFGIFNFGWIYIVAVVAEAIIFFSFVIHKNALGLSYRKVNSTREKTERSIIEGTGALQHALKNSLSIVLLNLQNAEYCSGDDDEASHVIPKIHQALDACQHADAILERIMLKINPINLELQSCALLPVVDQALRHCQSEHANKGIRVEKIVQATPQLPIDPVHIREALINLISNAMEAVADDGSGAITITVATYKKYANVKIEDNGCGLDKEVAKKVGMPVLTKKLDGKHYGLGLFYVTRVIKLHNGRFALRKSPRATTMAEIMLPLG